MGRNRLVSRRCRSASGWRDGRIWVSRSCSQSRDLVCGSLAPGARRVLASAPLSPDRCPCEQQSVLQNPAAPGHPEAAEAASAHGVLRGRRRGAAGRWASSTRARGCRQGGPALQARRHAPHGARRAGLLTHWGGCPGRGLWPACGPEVSAGRVAAGRPAVRGRPVSRALRPSWTAVGASSRTSEVSFYLH